MKLSNREKQLIWRSLCMSEELERERITNLSDNNRITKRAKENMIETSKSRLVEIELLKRKWWQSMGN